MILSKSHFLSSQPNPIGSKNTTHHLLSAFIYKKLYINNKLKEFYIFVISEKSIFHNLKHDNQTDQQVK